jgi:hypothetical protein
LDSVDPIQSIFNKKILAIDEFNGHVFPQPFKKKFTTKGWDILIDNHMSRTKSMLNAVRAAESDWVFYTEDDIVLELPSDFDLNNFIKAREEDIKTKMLVNGEVATDVSTLPLFEYQLPYNSNIAMIIKLVKVWTMNKRFGLTIKAIKVSDKQPEQPKETEVDFLD